MKREESLLFGVLTRRASGEWDKANPVPFTTDEVEARSAWIAQRVDELWEEVLDDAEDVRDVDDEPSDDDEEPETEES